MTQDQLRGKSDAAAVEAVSESEQWIAEAKLTLDRLGAFLQSIGAPHAVDWREWIGNAEKHVLALAEPAHSDDVAVDRFAAAMKAKLAKQRAKGYGGWETCPVERLQGMLFKHVPKGDPVDVANFAMMLSARGAATVYEEQWVFDLTGKWPGIAPSEAAAAEPVLLWVRAGASVIPGGYEVCERDDPNAIAVWDVPPVSEAAAVEPAETLLALAEDYAKHLVAVDFWSGKVVASVLLDAAYASKARLESFARHLAPASAQAEAPAPTKDNHHAEPLPEYFA
jgi:hypothetical protein